jgi:hypothetical protein
MTHLPALSKGPLKLNRIKNTVNLASSHAESKNVFEDFTSRTSAVEKESEAHFERALPLLSSSRSSSSSFLP